MILTLCWIVRGHTRVIREQTGQRLSPRRLLHSLDEVERLHGQVHGLETRVRQLVAAHESSEKTLEQLRTALAAFDPDRIASRAPLLRLRSHRSHFPMSSSTSCCRRTCTISS